MIYVYFIPNFLSRSDPIEISAGGPDELNDVADILLYFSTPPGSRFAQFALVRYYTVVDNEHLLLKVPHLKKRDVTKTETYGCLDIGTITGLPMSFLISIPRENTFGT